MSLKNVEPINFQFQFINKEMILHLFEITNASHKTFLCIILMRWTHLTRSVSNHIYDIYLVNSLKNGRQRHIYSLLNQNKIPCNISKDI